MKIIEQSAIIENAPSYPLALQVIEEAARTCYKSEDKMKPGSAEKLIKHCIKRGHESVLEHISISVRFICSRGMTHELVRHRHCGFSQESTRYCNYGGKDIEFIRPQWVDNEISEESFGKNDKENCWINATQYLEMVYKVMLKVGCSPQEARGVLPIDLKTELVVSTNIREWRHIFKLRCSKAAHPDMRALMIPLLAEMKENYPVFFEDLEM